MKQILSLVTIAVLSLLLNACAEKEISLKNAVCYDSNGFIAPCEEIGDDGIYEQAADEDALRAPKYEGFYCQLPEGCIGLYCVVSNNGGCANPFPCTVCGNCGNPRHCLD